MQLLDGKVAANALLLTIKEEVQARIDQNKKAPHLAAILVGHNPASQTYVSSKVKTCKELGFESTLIELPDTTSEEKLLEQITICNQDAGIDGILVQLPLPKHISESKVINAIHPDKDVDGFHPISLGKMMLGEPTFISATPNGIMHLLAYYNIPTAGKHCVVIGRSNIVGRPMSILLSRSGAQGDATVTVCHSKTKNLKELCLMADIIVAAIGRPKFVTTDMVKPGAVVIDVGINRIEDAATKSGTRLVGDVDFEAVAQKASAITPVPGGVGKMTIAALMQNTLLAVKDK